MALFEQGKQGCQMTGVGREIGVAEAGELGTGDEGETGVSAGGDVAHDVEEDAAHGVAGIDFDHRLDMDAAVGVTEGEGIDAQGSEVAELEELGSQAGEEVVEEGGELAEGERGGLAGLGDGGGKSMAMIGGGGIGEEPATGVGEETGEADEAEGLGGVVQLKGEIGQSLTPGFDHQGKAGLEGVVHPAPLGFLELGFPKSEGVTTGGAQGLFDDESGEAALAEVGDGIEGLVQGGGGQTGIIGMTHPWEVLPAEGWGRWMFGGERRRGGTEEESAEEIGAPAFGGELGCGGGELLR